MFGNTKVKPIFLIKIFFEIGSREQQEITEIITKIQKDFSEKLDDYHILVVPVFTTKTYEEPSFECFTVENFNEKRLAEFRSVIEESLEQPKE